MLERSLEGGAHARLDRIERLDLPRDGEAHPGERLALGELHGLGQLRRRRVERVSPGDDPVEERDVAHRLRHRPDLVETRGERDDAVARDRPVRRPQPHVPAQRRRLLDRAARVRAEPPGSEPGGHRRGRPPPEPPGTREGSHGFRDGPQAEFSVDDPIANSSVFVLPSSERPALFTRAATVASKTGVYPLRIREPAVVSTPLVEMTSLSAIGIPSPLGSSHVRR